MASARKELWFSIAFHGQKVGYVFGSDQRTQLDGQAVVHSRRRSLITVRRLRQVIRMEHRLDAWFEPDGTPLRYEVTRVEGGERRTGVGVRQGDTFVITQNVGGRTRTRSVDVTPDLRLSASLEWLYLRNPKPGARHEGRAIDESEGDVQAFLLSVGPENKPGAFEVTEKLGGIESRLQVIAGDGVIRSEIVRAGIVVERTSKEAAMQSNELVDIFSAANFEVDAYLPERSRLDGLVVRFWRESGVTPEVPTYPGQTVTEPEKGVIEVKTEVPRVPTSTVGLPLEDPERKAFLQGTDYEDLSDPALIRAATEQTKGAPSAWAAARRLNRFVNQHLEDKTLAHAYASATEAFNAKAGDCTEHAVLFSALAKIVGLPTRLVTGLIYVAGARPTFGYHEWVEVWLGDGWHPMDPTFDQDVADATHIKFSEGLSDADGLREAGLAAASLIGDIRLKVTSVIVDGTSRQP